jgi:hypothetical protein
VGSIAGTTITNRPRPKGPPRRNAPVPVIPQAVRPKKLPFGVEPELAQATPRYYIRDPNQFYSPETWQWLMLLNPIVWLMVFCAFNPHMSGVAFACFVFNMVLEGAIWIPANRNKDLISRGEYARTTSVELLEERGESGLSHRLYYKFKHRSGQTYHGNFYVPSDEVHRWENVKQATVLYDYFTPAKSTLYSRCPFKAVNPDIPMQVEPELASGPERTTVFRSDMFGSPDGMALIALASLAFIFSGGTLAVVFGLVVCALALYLWKTAAVEEQLVKNGVPASARVTDVIVSPNSEIASVEYDFDSVNGRASGSMNIPALEAPLMYRGMQLTALYELKDPSRNLLYKYAKFSAK